MTSLTLLRFWYANLSLLTSQEQAMLFRFWYQHCSREEAACKKDVWRVANFGRWKKDKHKPIYANDLGERHSI